HMGKPACPQNSFPLQLPSYYQFPECIIFPFIVTLFHHFPGRLPINTENVYDGEAVSSSYESYDEEEVTRGKSPSAQHQWPSAEASIELMKDARICAFLWRKKWLGQWAKQLCVIKEHRLLCYKSSKEQTPLLDVSLLGCSVVYKEKQLKRKEHKLKIIPVGGEAIVLGLQSKEQTEQWLKVTHSQDTRWLRRAAAAQTAMLKRQKTKMVCHFAPHVCMCVCIHIYQIYSRNLSSLIFCFSTVKKKYGAGLMFSNLMNIGKKKTSALESPEKCVDTSGYLNVLVNSQWRTCWCLIKNGQLWFYQDKGKNKVTQPAVTLEGCSVLPDPSPEHLYSFRIDMDGTQMATLEAKTSADMGHWLGLLLSQTGSKTDPEEGTAVQISSSTSYSWTLMEQLCIIHKSTPALNGTTLVSAAGKPEQEGAQIPTPSHAVEVKLGKNRTEADLRRYIDERDRLEKEREEVKISLANLKKEKREIKEELSAYPKQQASVEARLKQKEEACREAEQHRVEVELQLVQVKENLKKVESGPFTLGTTLDSSLQDSPVVISSLSSSPSSSSQPSNSNVNADSASPVNSASALKARPTSMMTTKGKVLQKAKVRFLYTIKASMSAS
uniref:Actin filament-associated protein 1-like 2 n=1 Tax=Amphilophus citrinellus TaxID=61819 RepID=A0A3Q0RXD6_AMPCI